MYNRLTRKGIALVLSLVLLLAICMPFSAGAEAQTDKSLEKYEEPIEIHFTRNIDDDLQDNIIPSTPGETLDSNRWLTAYEEMLGIKVVYDWVVKIGDAYTQKVNVTLASGDLPDAMFVTASQMKQLAEADMIVDLTPYWDEYASDLLKEIYTMQGDAPLNATKVDGKMMGLGFAEVFGDGTFIWIRADWLKKLNLEAPKTMADVLKISEAFTTQDPDGNGTNDTFGLAITKDVYNGCMGLEGFFAGYHAYPNMWIEDENGKLVYGSTLPETKQALSVLAEMYKAGQIDPEFGVKDGGKVAETIAAGKVGMEFGVQWNPMYPLISNYQNDPEADWTGYSLVSADDEKVYSPQGFGGAEYWVVSKECKNPEALIKMFNLHVELCWGETSDFDYYYMPAANDSKGVWKFSPVAPFPAYKNLTAFMKLQEARKNGTLDQLSGEAATIQRNIDAFHAGDTSQWGWEKIYGENGVFQYGVQYLENDQFLLESYTGVTTETMVERLATLEALEEEVFVKLIMGASPIDDFDKFVSDWNQLGGEQITKELNEWYVTVK